MPFECFYVVVIEKSLGVEQRLHRALAKYHLNKNHEFFEIEPARVVEILEMVQIEDVTLNKLAVGENEDLEVISRFNKCAERCSFKMIDILFGAEPEFDRDRRIICTVAENNKVKFRGEIESILAGGLIHCV